MSTELQSIIDLSYDAVLDPDLWPDVLDRVARAVGGRGAVLVSHDPARTARTTHSQALDAVGAEYGRTWWQRDTRIARARTLRLGPGSIVVDEHLFAPGETRSDPFFQDFFARHGLGNLGGYIASDFRSPHSLALSVPRALNRGAFDGAELERLRVLGPHVTRAFRMTAAFTATCARAHTLDTLIDGAGIGLIELDAGGQVRAVSAAAEGLIGRHLRVRIGRPPEPLNPKERPKLAALLAAFLGVPPGDGPRACFIQGAERTRPILVSGLPLRGAEVLGVDQGLLLLIQSPFAAIIASIAPKLVQLGLTQAEAQVAMLVGRGHSPRDAARQIEVSEHTVRSQLKAVYAKLGIGRQSELAVIVARLDTLL
ncbi:helix-turn-helix transcriptional regulator [Methylobacterium goesingense]|uniref:DNA-binding CsgD family transcriptional regulator/PAS domain-containing protein n=1 Tax=Methylobacterium goesingense TaxID=243690 RepID=A0ABV2L142_9HYPH|nr:helix-turn-helix transcriptional regulator [Methylobacterium goesingense]GJD73067.1 hypothetical protein CFIICLFH_1292 [Methylobacterium goesingense]